MLFLSTLRSIDLLKTNLFLPVAPFLGRISTNYSIIENQIATNSHTIATQSGGHRKKIGKTDENDVRSKIK